MTFSLKRKLLGLCNSLNEFLTKRNFYKMYMTEEHFLVQETTRKFAEERLWPTAAERDKTHAFPKAELAEMAELGLLGLIVPAAYDGAEMDYLAQVIATEEIAAGCGGTSTIVCIQAMVQSILMNCANEAQKQKYLKPLARGEKIGVFALTEPGAGSDAAALASTAVRDGDVYILNGSKQFITSGKNGDTAIVFAKTDPEQDKSGISAFIVEVGCEGYEVAGLEKKMGQKCSDTAQLTFNNMKVPAENRLEEEGDGYKIALSNLEGGRLSIAAQSLGMARKALEEATAYAKERHTFGKPIFEHQSVAFKLAEMATKLDAARLLTHRAAIMRQNGEKCLKEACMAKLMASEAAEQICNDAIQIFGGYGYVADFPAERLYRDVRVCPIYEGTSDIQKMIISRNL